MVDDGMALARSLGAESIDLSRGMREIQRRIVAANAREKDPTRHTRLHVDDGIHLNDLGQLAMGHALLKGLGAPAEVSSATSNGWEPGGPWDAQSDAVRELVDARDKAWGGEHFRRQFNGDNPASKKFEEDRSYTILGGVRRWNWSTENGYVEWAVISTLGSPWIGR